MDRSRVSTTAVRLKILMWPVCASVLEAFERNKQNIFFCRSFLQRKKKVTVSVSTVSFTVKRHSETGGHSDRKRSGRLKATTESEDKFLRVNSLHEDNSFKHSLIVVVVSKPQFQL